MAGLAGDVRLFALGSGFSFAAEGQLTQFGGKYTYTTGALGVGFRYDGYPWSAALYSGPSYATDPPKGIAQFQGKKLLNYVGLEVNHAIPHAHGWSVGLRMYHRSGAWGLYSIDNDEVTMFGIGVRKQF